MAVIVEYCSLTRYKHYKIKGKPTTLGADHGLNIAFDSKEIFVETEVKIYPFESFLAEFGGALSLFTGFTFVIILDLVEATLQNCRAKFK